MLRAHHGAQVFEHDVREWLHKVGRMPYLGTSLTGDPRDAWRDVEHVFRTVRTAELESWSSNHRARIIEQG